MYVPIILGLLSIIEEGAPLVQKLMDAAKQSGELTPEQSAEFDARLEAAFASRAWKTDDQLPPKT